MAFAVQEQFEFFEAGEDVRRPSLSRQFAASQRKA